MRKKTPVFFVPQIRYNVHTLLYEGGKLSQTSGDKIGFIVRYRY